MFMDIIHIDPWKKYPFFEDGLLETIKNINYISNINPKVKFEIGTEEAIRKFNFKEIVELIQELKMELNSTQFKNIQYICIQYNGHLLNVGSRDYIKFYYIPLFY